MNQAFKPEEIIQATEQGEVRIRSFCSPEEIRQWSFNPQFGSHARYRPLYTKRESLEETAAQDDANVTLALGDGNLIVGFGMLAYPDPGERWAELDPRLLMEVKAVEVARRWRSAGVAKDIITLLLRHPLIEEKIVYMVGYSWTWDLDGTQKTAQAYRRMLIALFEPFGFIEYQTNEPNICLKPENLFMGRIGRQVPEELQKAFKWLRFGITP
jgi:acetoin utilization protein AcuA